MKDLLEQRVNPPEPCEPYNLAELEAAEGTILDAFTGVLKASTIAKMIDVMYELEAEYNPPEQEYENDEW